MPQIRARISLEWGWLEYDAAGPTVQIEDRLLPQAMHAHFTGGGVQPAVDIVLRRGERSTAVPGPDYAVS